MQCEDGRADSRKEKAQENEKARGDRSDGRGLANQIVHPAEEKSPYRPYAASEINIRSASFRHSRAEFGNGQRAEERENPADNPNEEHEANRAGGASHRAGHEKNSSADDVAHDHGHCGPRAQPLHQLQFFLAQYPTHVPPCASCDWLPTTKASASLKPVRAA